MPGELVVAVELIRIEPGRGESSGWMAYLSTDGLGELDDGPAGSPSDGNSQRYRPDLSGRTPH